MHFDLHSSISLGHQFRNSCFHLLHWPPCASEYSISAHFDSGASQLLWWRQWSMHSIQRTIQFECCSAACVVMVLLGEFDLDYAPWTFNCDWLVNLCLKLQKWLAMNNLFIIQWDYAFPGVWSKDQITDFWIIENIKDQNEWMDSAWQRWVPCILPLDHDFCHCIVTPHSRSFTKSYSSTNWLLFGRAYAYPSVTIILSSQRATPGGTAITHISLLFHLFLWNGTTPFHSHAPKQVSACYGV